MASAKFLEEALSTDVDESAVNAIVGSLETQLVTNTPSLPGGHITTSANNQNSSISNGGSSVPAQKHSVANGETINVLFNADANKCISTNSLQSSSVNTNTSHTVVTAQGIVQNTYINQTGTNITQTNTQKGNENVKLVYQQGSQVINNRLYPAQTVQNGLVPLTQQNVLQTTQSVVNKPQSSMVIKSTNTNSVSAGMVSVPLNTNPAMTQMTVSNATVPTVMTLGKQVATGQQSLIGGSPLMSANVQILNMRPGVPVNQGQKSIATMAPRVVIGGPQMVGTRPGTPGQITLQTLQGLQPGQQGHLLLKTENGQYQLLRVGPAPQAASATVATPQMSQQATVATQGGTLRIQQTPTVSQVAARKTIVKLGTNVQNVSIPTTGTGTNATVTSATSGNQVVTQVVNVASNPDSIKTNAPLVTTQPGVVRNSVDNTKEKCRKFLANLLELSSREPKAVERNVRTLIQELIDSKVEPEEFCERLERLLNASPQPCLIGFLKKSLPLLRQSLLLKELVIEGIKPPPANVVYSSGATVPLQVQAAQSQVRLVHPTNITAAAGTVMQTTVRPTTIQQPRVMGPRTQIRTSTAVIRAQSTNSTVSATNPPALHPVSLGGSQFSATQQQQVRLQNARPGANMIRGASPARLITPTNINKTSGVNILNNAPNSATIRGAIQNAQNKAISLANSTVSINKHPTTFSTNKSVLNSINNISQISRPKEKKSFISAAAYAGDDDINDVAAMGGVNLAEETQRILGSTEMIGTQIRSCKDEIFLQSSPLQAKIRQISARHGLEEPSPDVMALISHATQERLKNIIEKLAVIAEHRIDVIKLDPRYETTQDVKGQLKFLEELDRAERKRHEEQEREMLLRAAKSRSKSEDPEQAKLKAKAKEMQRAEMEELRQREANLTALQAIGPRKKAKLEESSSNIQIGGASGSSGRPTTSLRPRLKRVNLRDMLFLLEQEKQTSRSSILCKSYLK